MRTRAIWMGIIGAVILLLALGVGWAALQIPAIARLVKPLPPSPVPMTESAVPSPIPGSRPEWIAFETRRGNLGDYEVYVITPDGSRLANLTQSWADDLAPVWALDGRSIAFVSFRDTLTGKASLEKVSSLYILPFDPLSGTSPEPVRRVTDGQSRDGWPTWSPDGQRLAFHSNRGGDWDIWVINLDGTGLTNLTHHPGADRYPAWSPDGKQIAFTSQRSGNEDIWVMNADGSNPVNLTQTPARDRYPMWSPDGQRLTFNTNRDGNQEIYVMNADGSDPINLSRSPDSTEGLASWSPDGRRVVLYSDRTGSKDLYIVDLETGRWFNLTDHPASDEFCTWSPWPW